MIYKFSNISIGIGYSSKAPNGIEQQIFQEILFLGIGKISIISTILKSKNSDFLYLLANLFDQVPIVFYTINQLQKESVRILNKSNKVYNIFGCYGIAESAALCASGKESTLIVEKKILKKSVTFAIAGRKIM